MFKLIKKKKQAKGNFNGGEILERKPIGFPQDDGEVRPYSNLFYWAHAWTPGKKSTIGLHPHRGFEICSFVLKGKIKHFDNKQNQWIPLSKGDVQIIRAGSGISHAEEIEEKSEIFQIWFNPDLSKSLESEASYNDYKNEDFPVKSKCNFLKKTLKGKNSPIKMETENIEIYEYEIQTGKIEISTNKNFTHSFFLLKGKIKINDFQMKKFDFAILNDSEKVTINSLSKSKIFEIKSPTNPSYATYF